MTLAESKRWLSDRWVLHPAYRAAEYPHHSSYARVDLRETFERVRRTQAPSFASVVEQTRAKLRLAYGRAA